MADKVFSLKIDAELLKKFREKAYKNYYNGKLKQIIEKFMEEYIKKEAK